MLRGQNIICFSKDFHEPATSNHHVLMELARHNRVLWLNSVATRTPRLTSGRDLRKIVAKLGSFARGPRRVQDDLWVYTPLVLPLPHSAAAMAINRRIVRATVRALRLALGMREFQLWSFLPSVAGYMGELGESLVVYYCIDEWSLFSYLDRDATVAAERRLCERADVVFASCRGLVERRRAINPDTYLATHGVDHARFAAALDDATRVPEDLARLPRPVIGFYGTIQDWIDQALIARLAERHPEWSVALLGDVHVNVSALRRLPNVHFLGRKPHADLPRYCKGFDVGLIPYLIDERMAYVNPLKLREYLSAGVPVVSTAVPEVARYGALCTVARDADELERGVAAALAADTAEARRRRSEAMRGETWEARVAEVQRVVAEVAARKARRGGATMAA